MKLEILVLPLALAASLPAQPIRVFSEFRRIGPDGQVIEQDRTGTPREILSPAVGRNAFASFQIVVTPPAGRPFALHIGDNPEGLFHYTLYHEVYAKEGSQWIPDVLEKVKVPYSATLPEPTSEIPNQSAMTFWLDVWVPADTPVRRIRIEVQLNSGDDWVIYPMEVRVQPGTVPKLEPVKAVGLAPVGANSADSAFTAMKGYLCGSPEKGEEKQVTIRSLIHRNAHQDAALAKALEPAQGVENLQKAMLLQLGAAEVKAWCGAKAQAGYDPEVYLKVRDYLLKTAMK